MVILPYCSCQLFNCTFFLRYEQINDDDDDDDDDIHNINCLFQMQ